MSWGAPIFYDDEDESALRAEFVRLSALWPHYDAYEIAKTAFRNLGARDPETRCLRAADFWKGQLEVQDEIRKARLGVKTEAVPTREEIALRLVAIGDNSGTAEKERVSAYKAAAEVLGYVSKGAAEGSGKGGGNVNEVLSELSDRLPG